jgi:SAM-dependent methyltransferase
VQPALVARPRDYDTSPGRFRLAQRIGRDYLTGGPTLHEHIWDVLAAACGGQPLLVADVGCGDGALTAARPADRRARVVGLDASVGLLRDHPGPAVRADAARLPLRAGRLDAVVAVNMLYHLDDPVTAIAEARRVLAPGGVFLAATVSRDDSPELRHVWRPAPSCFDAEDAPGLVEQVFGAAETERWDAPLIRLPDAGAVRDYLLARFVPPAAAARAAQKVPVPLTVTKRGALVWARA